MVLACGPCDLLPSLSGVVSAHVRGRGLRECEGLMETGGSAARAVLVIGAHGVLGSALARAFEDAGWRVARGVRRGDDARGCTPVDLDRSDTVAAAIAGVDLVLDPVPHPGLTAERAVLREGGALIDVSMRPAAAARRLRAEATSARGTVVVNAGRTPGVSNLVVADLLAAHPDADAIEIVFSFTAGGTSGRAGGESVHRYLTSLRRHATAVIPFPAPIGPTRCLRFAESEDGWLGDLAGGRAVATYARFSPKVLHCAVLGVNALRLMQLLPLAAFVPRGKSSPTELTSESLTEWVGVRRQGTVVETRTITGAGNYRVTAAATLVLAEALLDPARHDRARPGCFEPQELFTLPELAANLRKRGVAVNPVAWARSAGPLPS
jgi:NAD(P)-dependent dehydrogenase (short-subunit alcohol dehydrogenase family)